MGEALRRRVNQEVNNLLKVQGLLAHGVPDHIVLGLFYPDGHGHIQLSGNAEADLRVCRELNTAIGFSPTKVDVDQLAAQLSAKLNLGGRSEAGIKIETGDVIDASKRKIIFAHNRAAGDGLMFSAGIRDFKLLFPEITIGVDSNQKWIWENNPYIDTTLRRDDPDVEYYKVGYPAVGYCTNGYTHFSGMFLLDMVAATDLHHRLPISLGEFCASFSNGDVGDPNMGNPEKNDKAHEPFISLREKFKNLCNNYARQRGDLYLNEEEKHYNMIKEMFGVEKYWVIAPGGKRDATTKIWDWRKFQQVVDHFKGRITFVMIGRSDHLIERIDGVINLVDKTNLRQLVPIVYHSEGCVSGLSLLMHLSAAVPSKRGNQAKPCVTIMGGREPTAWTWYCNHQILHTNGVFSCCERGGCWKARVFPLQKDPKHNKNLCKNQIQVDGRTTQACMEIITADDVIRAIELYYQGDLLTYDKGADVAQAVERVAAGDADAGSIPAVRSIDGESAIPSGVCPQCYDYYKKHGGKWLDGESHGVSLNLEEEVYTAEAAKEKGMCVREYLARSTSETTATGGIAAHNAVSKTGYIDILGNLHIDGGGELSLLTIARELQKTGWSVTIWPWKEEVHEKNKRTAENWGLKFADGCFENMAERMHEDRPLLFYANDRVWDFPKLAQPIVAKCSMVIMGVNFMLGHFKDPHFSDWLSKSGKLKAVIVQNREKAEEWQNQVIGFESTKVITLFGAVDVDAFYEVCPQPRQDKEPLVILKHCKPDGRKYVTESSHNKGDKIHIWQKNFEKELDTKFYKRLLKDMGKSVRFEFMEAHGELAEHFKGEERMVFHKWDAMPVTQFLSRGHVYLYRTSNDWRDNYPRCVAEALASGLPVLSEPRDGTADRVVHGDTGFYFCHYDECLTHLKTLKRKEKLRQAMGQYAKDWARERLNPRAWADVIDGIVNGNGRIY